MKVMIASTSLLLGFGVLLLVCSTGWGFWHILGETGKDQVVGRVQEEMLTAYEEGRYRDVVSLYEARHHVRLMTDWSPESTRLRADMVFRVAESYREEGDDEAARLHYLALIGWTEWEYQSYCRLGLNECASVAGLRDLAHIKTGAAR